MPHAANSSASFNIWSWPPSMPPPSKLFRYIAIYIYFTIYYRYLSDFLISYIRFISANDGYACLSISFILIFHARRLCAGHRIFRSFSTSPPTNSTVPHFRIVLYFRAARRVMSKVITAPVTMIL